MKLLCIGNGGVVVDDGVVLTHRPDVAFVRELADLGAEVCYCGWSDSANDPLSQQPLAGGGRIRGLALPRVEGGIAGRGLNAARALALLVGEVLRADVVYIYWPGQLAVIAAAICRLLRRPYGIYFRGELIQSPATFARAFSSADFVIAAGETLRSLAASYCRDVETVTPMTALRRHHLAPAKAHPRRKPVRLLFVGRVERRKGSHDLVAAMAELSRRGVAAQLTLAGHCADPAALLATVSPEVAARIALPGAIGEFDALASLYREADVFVFPSHDEGFPRVLYEAMAFGLPIVTTFVGSIATVMKDRVNCLEVPVADATAIADRVEALATDAVLYETVARNARATVERQMDSWRGSHATQVWSRAARLAATEPGGRNG